MRTKIIRVSKKMMARFLTADVGKDWSSNAPPDLKVLMVREGHNPNVFEVICESGVFDEVREHEIPPDLIVIFKETP
jgi:hypothetical protein